MKLLVIAPFYRWFIKDLVEAQAKYLEDIQVIVHHNALSELSKYLPIGGYLNHVRLYTKENIVNTEGTPKNVHLHIISTTYLVPDGRNWKLGDKLVKLFEKYILKKGIKFELIHAHFTWPQGYVAVKLGKKFNVPVVVTLHENQMYLSSILKNVPEKATFVWENSDVLIRVTRKDVPLFIKYGANPDKIYYAPNGYNPDRLKPIPKDIARKKLGLNTEAKILFNLARLHPAKGHEILINAMTQIVRERNDVFCYIGGTGQLKNKLAHQIKALNLENYVKLLGYLPNSDVSYWMNAADVFVLPSLTEGNPTVMFEALGIGLPFVGTKVGGVPEIITSEDYGLLVEPEDPKDLAEKILIALEKEWDREKIRQYAKQFTWDKISNKILKIYNVIGGS